MFDIMLYAQAVASFDNFFGVLFPVRAFGHGKIICAADFVEIDKGGSCLDDFDSTFCVQGRLDTYPSKYPGIVKLAQGAKAVLRKRCLGFPLFRHSIVKESERRSECVHAWSKKIDVSQRSGSALCKGTKWNVKLNQCLKTLSGKAGISGVVRIGREAEKNLVNFLRIVGKMLAVFSEKAQIVLTFIGAAIELFSIHSQDGRNVAVSASVTTATVGIGCKGGVL